MQSKSTLPTLEELWQRGISGVNLSLIHIFDKIVEEVLERKAECILCMDDAVCSRVLKKLREKNVKAIHSAGRRR